MSIKEMVADVKEKAAHSRRRAVAVADHSKAVVASGIDAVQNVASVAAQSVKTGVAAQKAALTDSSLGVSERVRLAGKNVGVAVSYAKQEVAGAIKKGFADVTDRLMHVTAVTHAEQALENKISRKVKKAKKRAASEVAA